MGVAEDVRRVLHRRDGDAVQRRDDLREISKLGADSRLTGLVFGPVDSTAELGGRAIDGSRPTWDGLLADLSNEASANGLVREVGEQAVPRRAGAVDGAAAEFGDRKSVV